MKNTTAAAMVVVTVLWALDPRPAPAQATLPDGFRDSLVIAGLDAPVGMAFLPDGRLLVVEQKTGNIRLVRNGEVGSPNPMFTVPGIETDGLERGLLGIAVDPGWPSRPYLYVHLDDLDTETIRVTRYTVAGDLSYTGNGNLTIVGGSRRDILNDVYDGSPYHNGGTLRFGGDGMLYVSLGDDGSRCAAQDQASLRGVILRLDVSDVPAGGGPVPPRASIAAEGNPLANAPDIRSRLIWAWGMRNPFRFIVDAGNNALFIGDVGENTWEEVDRADTGGLNFGWPRYEALAAFDTSCPLSSDNTEPIHAYNHDIGGLVVIPAGVYRPPSGECDGCFPDTYEGSFFLSDYYGGFMRRLTGSGDSWSIAPEVPGQPSATDWGRGFENVSQYEFSAGGGLWYCDQGAGEIRAILGPVASDTTPPPPPPPPSTTFSFDRPYPQPAPGAVNLSYTLADAARVKLRIYDLRGALVRTLVDGDRPAGTRVEVWDGVSDDGERLPSGLYLARLESAGHSAEQRVMMVR